MFDYDAELRRYQSRLWSVLEIGSGDRVLDVGCGTGQTTRRAARAATGGEAIGIDVSEQMLARARELSATDGIDNIGFERGDAQSHPFPTERFNVGISRFGTMFFDDPVVAFTNIARSLRPDAPFVQIVWQAVDRQEWESVIRDALTPGAPPAAGAAAFSLADPDTVRGVLTASGFTDVELVDLHEPVYYGRDAAAARDSVLALTSPRESLDALPGDRVDPAVRRLEEKLRAYESDDGVWFDSRAWLVTAGRG
jgi:ubiquinone/menaquinone biosynthesis C-methylase UbiE